jgi:hypothetical protein
MSIAQQTVERKSQEAGLVAPQYPAQYIEIYNSADGWRWRWVGKYGMRNVSSQTYATPLEAALTGAVVAHCHGLMLRTGCNVLNQDLIFAWQVQGMERAKAGEPIETCWNAYMRQGWLSIHEPVAFGWPVVAEVAA